jgi:phage shock protein C
MWSGVCGGIAEYFQVDPTLVRAFFVIATIFSVGGFFLVYLALVVIMPVHGAPAAGSSAPTPSGEPGDATQRVEPAHWHDPDAAARRREAVGWLLVALGVVFLLGNAGLFRLVQWNLVWPIALIALGAFIVLQRSRP